MGDNKSKNNAPESLSLKELLEKRDKEKGISQKHEDTPIDFRETLKKGLDAHHDADVDKKTESNVFSEIRLRGELQKKFGESKPDTAEKRSLSEMIAMACPRTDSDEGTNSDKSPSDKHQDFRKMIENAVNNKSCSLSKDEKAPEKVQIPDSAEKTEPKTAKKESKKPDNKKSDKKEKNSVTPKSIPVTESSKDRNDRILSSLKASDIKTAATATKKSRLPEIARRFAMAVLLIVMVGACLYLGFSIYSRTAADRYYSQLREKFYSENSGALSDISQLVMDNGSLPEPMLFSAEGNVFEAPDLSDDDLYSKYTKMLPNLEALKSINSAAFAWIRVEGTRVDYPVVQSPQGNNDYYLDHGLDRSYSVSGTVFTDFANSRDLSKNRNTCVYGHNMNDGTMFQTIMNFKTLNQFKNGTIEMYTKDGIYVYRPFAVYEAVPTESFFKVNFSSDEEFSAFLSECRSKSLFDAGIDLSPDDKVVTLITCTNTIIDKRFVVQGVLTDIIK